MTTRRIRDSGAAAPEHSTDIATRTDQDDPPESHQAVVIGAAVGVVSDKIAERVAILEQAQHRLEHTTETLKRGQRDMRRQVRHLEAIVEALPDHIAKLTDDQTEKIRAMVAESTLAAFVNLARQWPAGAIVAVTLVGGGLITVVVDLISQAVGGPHLK